MCRGRFLPGMAFRSWQQLVTAPEGERHIVQLYREHGFLVEAVSAWAAPALRSTGGVVLVGAPRNVDAILRRLAEEGLDVDALRRSGRLAIVGAEDLMARFMVDGMPDAAAFKAVAGEVIQAVQAACPAERAEVRAWGEMVNLLWHQGNRAAAQRLEALWNEVIDAHGIRLLCSYAVDNLAPETHADALAHVCAGHSQLIPEPDFDALDRAVGLALVDVFGEDEAGLVRTLFSRKRRLPIGMPPAEAVLVALQETQPELGRRVLASTRMHIRDQEAA
jgi:hypothetical protein